MTAKSHSEPTEATEAATGKLTIFTEVSNHHDNSNFARFTFVLKKGETLLPAFIIVDSRRKVSIMRFLSSTPLLLILAMSHSVTASLNTTVQVSLIPGPSSQFPACSNSLLTLFQPLLTYWVSEATSSIVPGFTMSSGFALARYNNYNFFKRRNLRGGVADDSSSDTNTNNKEEDTSSLSRSRRLGSCSTCTSAGCATYCGPATCTLCAGSRRLQESTNPASSTIDLVALGNQVSSTVQGQIQNLLESNTLDLVGCLGDPLFLTVNVAFS